MRRVGLLLFSIMLVLVGGIAGTAAANQSAPDSVSVEVDPESTQTTGESITGPPTANVTSSGEPVEGVNVTVSANESDVLRGTTTATTDQDGLAVFDDLRIEQAGDYTLVFDVDEVDTTSSSQFTVESTEDDGGDGNETDPVFELSISETNSPIEAGDTLAVTANITNGGGSGTQTVTLTDSGFTDSQQDDTEVSLDSNESDSVVLEWNTTTDDVDEGTVTVATDGDTDSVAVTVETPDEPPAFEVDTAETNTSVEAGETLAVSVNVTNVGGNGTQTVTLTDTEFTDSQQDDTEISLGGGESDTVVLEWDTSTDDVGEGVVTVATESDSESVVVDVEDVDVDSVFEINITETNTPVEAGDTLVLTANVTNVGNESTQTVTLNDTDFTDSQQDDAEINLDSGESSSVILEWKTSTNDTGEGILTVATDDETDSVAVAIEETDTDGGDGDNETTATADDEPDEETDDSADEESTVEDETTETETTETETTETDTPETDNGETDESAPGFGVVVAVVALISGGLLARRY